MKFHHAGAELFHADGQTDGHDISKSCFSLFLFAKAPKRVCIT